MPLACRVIVYAYLIKHSLFLQCLYSHLPCDRICGILFFFGDDDHEWEVTNCCHEYQIQGVK